MKKTTKKQITINLMIIVILFVFWQVRSCNDRRDVAMGENTIELHVIDVGQGDSVLIRTESGNMLIDAGTGESEEALAEYLGELGIESFEYCVFTHPHEDHIGGADMIIRNYDVKNVIMSGAVTDTRCFESLLEALEESDANVIEAEPGLRYNMGELEILIMGPSVIGNDRDLNNSSVITRLTYGDFRMLFTGDAEKLQEGDILEAYTIFDLDCDFLKMGHHGSSTSSGESFMDAVTPRYAAISCGEDNSYGHPHREIVALLEERGIEYHRTDELGDLVYVCDGKSFELKK